MPAPTAARSNTLGKRLGWLILAAFLLFGATLYATSSFGWVNGQEFSPQSFRRREFSYYEMPLIGWQVTRVTRSTKNDELASYLVRQSLVPTTNNPQDRWDLAWADRGAGSRITSDAQILCRYLDATDAEGQVVWLEWTKENKPAAKELWPLVAQLAAQELYVFIPDLFAIASGTCDPQVLRDRCAETLTRRYVDFAKNQQRLEQHELAIELFTEAIALSPEHTAALEGRADSYSKLGHSQLAETDFAKARQLNNRPPLPLEEVEPQATERAD